MPAASARTISVATACLADIFHPDQIEHSLTTLETAQPDNTPALDSARRELAQLDQKMAGYRKALEAVPSARHRASLRGVGLGGAVSRWRVTGKIGAWGSRDPDTMHTHPKWRTR
ncbi:hypothetical protein OG225_11590 [Nocardia sp. NBC_01377]|uniref:hypothetical protein n=1 Tax=Nocardia sp. NBC_01377 TaxID=2903595 RepID=UPI0032514D67